MRAIVSFASLVLAADAMSPMRADDGPPRDVTHMGCTCTSDCSVTLVDHDSSRCDWCWTADGCGRGGFKSWDYCKYPQQDDWEAQHHMEKLASLWTSITDPRFVDKSGPTHLVATTLKLIMTTSMITTFEDNFEVLPPGRKKVIHTQGVNCRIDLNVRSDSPFTGVLSPGKQSGLIRFGSATSLDEPIAGKIFPGFGIKFLRSGVRSADWVALRATGPGGSYNFFDSLFSNHVAPDDRLLKLGRFQQASGCVDMVGLSDACTYTQAGDKVDKPEFPFQISFEPTGNVNFPAEEKSNDDLLMELSSIPVGTELFNVIAFMSPADAAKGQAVTIGTLATSSQCHQSLFGDLNLFFRHQRMEEDFALKPHWIQQMWQLDDGACEATTGPMEQWQCPHLSGQAVDV